MPVETADALLDALHESGLLTDSQLREVSRAWRGRLAEPGDLVHILREKGWLTAFQAEQLLQGHANRLVIGPYRLLDRLGEGGMGEVYKALHNNLQRTVALKVIRPEHMSRPQVLERFRREARAAARLAHPNIVTLYDADQIGDTYFLAMEYIDGLDLGRLVQLAGPLPVMQACDYIRQAALGLHHAHERGLVHRDVKPSNLLVMARDATESGINSLVSDEEPTTPDPAIAARYAGGVVKVLDMGIARMLVEASAEANLTQEGAVLGTVDYLAPEQASNSRAADRRADLYSLGCTFYHLLTGQPPYPEGNAFAKLVQHKLEEPRPIRSSRPDVPAAVVGILGRLMAKRPEDRYRTAAEVAAALAMPAGSASSVRTALSPSRARVASRSISQGPPTTQITSGAETSEKALRLVPVAEGEKADRPAPRRRRWGLLGLTLVSAWVLAGGVIAWRSGRFATCDVPPLQENHLPTETATPTPSPASQPGVDPLAGFVPPKAAAVFTLNLHQMLQSPAFAKLHGTQWEADLRKGNKGWSWVPLVGADPGKDLQQVQFFLFPHVNNPAMVLARGRFDPGHFVLGPNRLEEVPAGVEKSLRFFHHKDARTGTTTLFAPIGSDLIVAEASRMTAVVALATGVTQVRPPEDSLLQARLKEVDRQQSLWLAVSFDKLNPVPRLDHAVLELYLRPLLRCAQSVQGGITYGTDEVRAHFVFHARDDDNASKLEKFLRDTCEAAKAARHGVKEKDLLPWFRLLAVCQRQRAGTRVELHGRLTAAQLSR